MSHQVATHHHGNPVAGSHHLTIAVPILEGVTSRNPLLLAQDDLSPAGICLAVALKFDFCEVGVHVKSRTDVWLGKHYSF